MLFFRYIFIKGSGTLCCFIIHFLWICFLDSHNLFSQWSEIRIILFVTIVGPTADAALAAAALHVLAIGLLLRFLLRFVFVLLFVVHKMADSAKGLPAIFAFTGVWGASIGPMLSFYLAMDNGPTMVLQALAGTALVFFSLSAYALNTKKDFSYMGGFLMTGLIVAVVAMIANIFLAIPALSLTLSAVVVMIMAGLILFDTSRIIHGGETNYIRATVGLYLNIFNLFIHLLHLIAVFTGGDD